MSIEGLEITRENNGDSGEYHAKLPDSDAVGRLTWVAREQGGTKVRVAEHTLVPQEIGRRGVAAELVQALVADAREQDFRIVPQCSYVEAKFDEHPDWSDLRA